MHICRWRQSGLSIIELMVALLISSILIAGAISLFLATSKTRITSQHINKVATDTRFLTSFIAHDIRMAGFRGNCGPIKKPGLVWKGKNTLIIRYCNNNSIDKIKYLFNQRTKLIHNKDKCTGKGGNHVCYYNSKIKSMNNAKPLLGGIKLSHMFSHFLYSKKKNGTLKYFPILIKKYYMSNFSHIRSVQLQFTVLDNSLSNLKLNSGNYLKPTFNITAAVRNNNL